MDEHPPLPSENQPPAETRSICAKLLPWVVLLLLVAVWSRENNYLQATTLYSDSGWQPDDYREAIVFRMLLNILFCTAMALLMPRWVLAIFFVVLLVFTQVAGFYFVYFGKALSWTTIRTQFMEGTESVVLDEAFLMSHLVISASILLVAKLALLWLMGRHPIRRRQRYRTGTAVALAYLAVIVAFNNISTTRLPAMIRWMSFDRMATAHGYMVTWVGEAIYVSNDTLLDEALEAREHRDNNIAPIEGPLDLPGHVAIIQVESLDWHVLGLERDGKPVTPHLNAMRDTAMLFQVESIHMNGSADADFVMLQGCMPSSDVIGYKIAGYPFGDSLAAAAGRAGLPMMAFHGNNGNFFGRRDAFEQMGFDEIAFSEELAGVYGLPQREWSAVPDRDILEFSARLLDEADGPRSHFIITYTSHMPFIMLPEEEPRPFTTTEDHVYERYFNSIHYVDDAIGRYIEAVPEGTTVVIYSDHESACGYPERVRAVDEPELIPVFVWRKGEDLSARQQTATMPEARSGAWSMVDVAMWVRGWFDAAAPEPTPGDGQDTPPPAEPTPAGPDPQDPGTPAPPPSGAVSFHHLPRPALKCYTTPIR